MKYDRIFFFGDSITLGANDNVGLGWPGRLCRGLAHEPISVAAYNLGINGDTSHDIAIRWRTEAIARSRNAKGLLLFAFGFNDASKCDGNDFQIDLATSISTARNLLIEAQSFSEVLWIGPTPLDETVNPLQTGYASWETKNSDIVKYDEAYTRLAKEMGVDYLPLYPKLLHHPRYKAALLAGDKVHPGDDGYALIAEQIAHWEPWIQRTKQP